MTDREQDVLIAKAMGLSPIDWYYHKDPECGGLEPVMEDDEGNPYLALMDWSDSGDGEKTIGQLYRESAIVEPTIKTLDGKRTDGSDFFTYKPIPQYETPECSWLILDYVRENSDSKFAQVFEERLDFLLDPHRYHEHHFMLNTVFARMTPSIIKQAAYEAAKECME